MIRRNSHHQNLMFGLEIEIVFWNWKGAYFRRIDLTYVLLMLKRGTICNYESKAINPPLMLLFEMNVLYWDRSLNKSK